MNKIITGISPKKGEIGSSHKIDPKINDIVNWTFSFQYWRQIKFFGLSETEPKWFVSLLDRLQSLSSIESDRFKKDRAMMKQNRYHPINWEQQNIPIEIDDLDWLPKDILSNQIEFELVQFQISTSLGRVVGYWHGPVFYIVLLDPLHNIQPAGGRYGYKVDPNIPLNCHYSDLLNKIEHFSYSSTCNSPDCGFLERLPMLKSKPDMYKNVVLHFADDALIQRAEELLKLDGIDSYAQLLEWGIIEAEKFSKQDE